MILETKRLLLRPWREEDAPQLYRYASDPRVGPAAGWKSHASVEESLEVIRTVLSAEGTLAVTVKALGDRPVGSVGMFPCEVPEANGEMELGYWLAVPLWGQGLIPEAVRELQRYLFEERGAEGCWCAHFEGNEPSRRVIEKCGFTYRTTRETGPWPAGGMRMTRFYAITRREYLGAGGQEGR